MEGAPAPEQPTEASFGDLPPALLGRILALMGTAKEIGPTVTLVSKAWRDAFYSEPGLWGSFRLSAVSLRRHGQHAAEWFAAQHVLLQRVAPMVVEATVDGGEQLSSALANTGLRWNMEELLRLLPSTLAHLRVNYWQHSMPPSLLANFPSLRSLYLARCGCDREQHWPPAVLEAICSMQQLTDLTISAQSPPPQLLAALAGSLPQLQWLDVCSWSELPHAERLTRLTALKFVSLREYGLGTTKCLQPPAPARLPSLQFYGFGAISSSFQFPGAGVIGGAAAAETEEGLRTLQISGIEELISLPVMLEALEPPAAPALRFLSLQGQLDVPPLAAAIPAASAVARQLEQLCELHLDSNDSMLAVLEALLAHAAPQLTHLECRGGLGSQLPRCVAELRALRRLALRNTQLADLPDGPYLENLEHLGLVHNSLTALPPALSAATALTGLVLSINTSLALSDEDVDSILLRLPRLAELHVDNTDTHPAVLERLQRARPQLSIQ